MCPHLKRAAPKFSLRCSPVCCVFQSNLLVLEHHAAGVDARADARHAFAGGVEDVESARFGIAVGVDVGADVDVAVGVVDVDTYRTANFSVVAEDVGRNEGARVGAERGQSGGHVARVVVCVVAQDVEVHVVGGDDRAGSGAAGHGEREVDGRIVFLHKKPVKYKRPEGITNHFTISK